MKMCENQYIAIQLHESFLTLDDALVLQCVIGYATSVYLVMFQIKCSKRKRNFEVFRCST